MSFEKRYLNDRNGRVSDKIDRKIITPSMLGYVNDIKGNHGIVYKRDPITGEETVIGHNNIIAPGASKMACDEWGITPTSNFLSYNTALNLENIVASAPESRDIISLWCVGTDGCDLDDDSLVYPVDYKKWIPTESLVPFIYSEEDISESERNMYFGRKIITSEDAPDIFAYYFKTFESQPTLHRVYADGTPVDVSTLYSSNNASTMTTYVESNFNVQLKDCRDWFKKKGTLRNAKINTISLCSAWKKEINSHIYYQNIQAHTKINIENERISDLTKGIEFIYRLFY